VADAGIRSIPNGAGNLHRHPGLAHAARAGQGDQPGMAPMQLIENGFDEVARPMKEVSGSGTAGRANRGAGPALNGVPRGASASGGRSGGVMNAPSPKG
jgi:hypothetical protein